MISILLLLLACNQSPQQTTSALNWVKVASPIPYYECYEYSRLSNTWSHDDRTEGVMCFPLELK